MQSRLKLKWPALFAGHYQIIGFAAYRICLRYFQQAHFALVKFALSIFKIQ